jgi:hypothetical protein
MIADELKVLFDDLRKDIAAVRLDIALLSYDVSKLKEQLDKQIYSQPQESIGIAPNTPPPDFLPPEKM